MPTAAAESIRDRRLAENAYPKSVPIGGLASDASRDVREARLDVVCAGYVYSMNRRYMELDVGPGNISDQASLLVDGSADAAEFVSAGAIDSNTTITPTVPGGNLSIRLWDMMEELAEMGDTSNNRWIAGVYDGRKLDYKQAENDVEFYWRNGRLCNAAGHPIYPTQIEPNIIVRVDDTPWGITPGSGNEWANPRQAYIETVEFIAPRSYRLTPYEGEELLGTF